MSRSSEQKIRMLVLYDILRKESDEDSPLSTNELIENSVSMVLRQQGRPSMTI